MAGSFGTEGGHTTITTYLTLNYEHVNRWDTKPLLHFSQALSQSYCEGDGACVMFQNDVIPNLFGFFGLSHYSFAYTIPKTSHILPKPEQAYASAPSQHVLRLSDNQSWWKV